MHRVLKIYTRQNFLKMMYHVFLYPFFYLFFSIFLNLFIYYYYFLVIFQLLVFLDLRGIIKTVEK